MFEKSMDFGFDEEIKILQKNVRKFAQSEIAPLAKQIDETNEFPNHLWKKSGKDGIINYL